MGAGQYNAISRFKIIESGTHGMGQWASRAEWDHTGRPEFYNFESSYSSAVHWPHGTLTPKIYLIFLAP